MYRYMESPVMYGCGARTEDRAVLDATHCGSRMDGMQRDENDE